MFSACSPTVIWSHQVKYQYGNADEQAEKLPCLFNIGVLHFRKIIEQQRPVVVLKPLKNTRNVHQAVGTENHKKANDQRSDIELKNREDAHYSHSPVDQNPDNRIGIVYLNKGKYEKHDGKNEVSYSHNVFELSGCNMQRYDSLPWTVFNKKMPAEADIFWK